MNDHSLTKFINLNALVVEDYDFNREILSEMLSVLGINVDVSSDGEDAVNKVINKQYDLIVMDVRMPKKNGYQATKEIRAMNIKQPFIIGLTASTLMHDHDLCKESGMNDCLTKPLVLEDLEKCFIKHFPEYIQKQ
jgi:CheY-like chemotaxis protein